MNEKDITFIFHGAWLNYIEGLTEEQKLKVVWDIVNYGADKDLTYSKEDKFVATIVNFVKGNIDNSKKNYEATIERNQRGGRKKIIDEKQCKDEKYLVNNKDNIVLCKSISLVIIFKLLLFFFKKEK